jgi:hypothetical protein
MPVVRSFEDAHGLRCLDLIRQSDQTFVLREFRRDPEDGGRWSLVADYSAVSYRSEQDAIAAAGLAVTWFAERPSTSGLKRRLVPPEREKRCVTE